jgi:hypothetical protein
VQHKPDRHQIVVKVVKKRAATGGIIERPAECVLDQAFAMLFRRDLPELLEA